MDFEGINICCFCALSISFVVNNDEILRKWDLELNKKHVFLVRFHSRWILSIRWQLQHPQNGNAMFHSLRINSASCNVIAQKCDNGVGWDVEKKHHRFMNRSNGVDDHIKDTTSKCLRHRFMIMAHGRYHTVQQSGSNYGRAYFWVNESLRNSRVNIHLSILLVCFRIRKCWNYLLFLTVF